MASKKQGYAMAIAAAAGVLGASNPSSAALINDLFVFGDSYSDTGAYVVLTNGDTSVGYLAQNFGITLTTSKNPDPGTDGVNFAESGARVFVGPNPPATQPRSLTQQVAEFQNYVQNGDVTFDPTSTLFFLAGGLNDHTLVNRTRSTLRRPRRSRRCTTSAPVCSKSPCCQPTSRPSPTARTISTPGTKRSFQNFSQNSRMRCSGSAIGGRTTTTSSPIRQNIT